MILRDIKTVTWENTLSGVTGTAFVGPGTGGGVVVLPDWSTSVPLQDGENLIKIFCNGAWGDSITVTRFPSFGVSGTVSYVGTGQLKIKLTLADISNASSLFSAYTDSTGFYHFTYIPAGTYTLTPTDPCYTFTPPYMQVKITGSDISSQNFIINAKPFATISGRITYASNSSLGVKSAFVTLSSATTSTVLTHPDGYYTFTCVSNGTYTTTPSLYNYSFNPLNRNITVTGGADVPGQDFTQL